ncbi:MAG: TRAP transporter small permease subunit [Gammaproteobacteria bacterium]|nr:TRAP transporter small permease subunit [Gammaproteobacteria bacterium]
MPSVTFVLPHWLYWSGLVLFPLVAMFALARRDKSGAPEHGTSRAIAYFLLVTAGFAGMHRLYLRNLRGLLFVPVFIALLLANAESRESREGISYAGNQTAKAEFLLERARKDQAGGKQGAAQKVRAHQLELQRWREQLSAAEAVQSRWVGIVRACALTILAGLLFDLFRVPALKRRCDALDRSDPPRRFDFGHARVAATADGGRIKPENTAFARLVGRVNDFSGAFVAYWSVIAVFVYYYEVLARYVFNSPTNWAHESMFLMFGAQYLLAGGFCLREDAHVRVDVFYMRFSKKGKALVDVLTSVFFFIFAVSLLTSGWTFFNDSFQVREVSFTEWGIQYYPIKLTLAAGAALLLLQGISRLLHDIAILRSPTPEAADGA